MTNDEQYTIINDKTQMYISILPLQNENKLDWTNIKPYQRLQLCFCYELKCVVIVGQIFLFVGQ
jgi:hypothetical protein